MLVWGGWDTRAAFGDGAAYSPAADAWEPTAAADAPSPGLGHAAVWTGAEMLVWGGLGGDGPLGRVLADGGRYDPVGERWAALPAEGALALELGHLAADGGRGDADGVVAHQRLGRHRRRLPDVVLDDGLQDAFFAFGKPEL
jgi:hypothetical protein